MTMNWSAWLYETITTDTWFSDPIVVLGPGASEGRIDAKPFIMIRVGAENPELEGDEEVIATSTFAEIWVHDEPGSYLGIDVILDHLRTLLSGPMASATGGLTCRWQGNSPQLSDEGYGTITKYGSFRLIGALQ